MSVYFALKGDLIKIGFSSNVPQRIRQLGRGATLLVEIPGERHLERALQQTFWLDHVAGEWFSDSRPLRKYIDGVRAHGGGEPQFPQDDPEEISACTCSRLPRHLNGAHH